MNLCGGIQSERLLIFECNLACVVVFHVLKYIPVY